MSLGSRFYRQKGRVTMDENELMGSMKVSKAVAKMAIPSGSSQSDESDFYIIHGICQYVWYGRKRSGIYGIG